MLWALQVITLVNNIDIEMNFSSFNMDDQNTFFPATFTSFTVSQAQLAYHATLIVILLIATFFMAPLSFLVVV